MDLKMKLKYDVYKGTAEDMQNCGGELIDRKVSATGLARFADNSADKVERLHDGELVHTSKGTIWIEEAA